MSESSVPVAARPVPARRGSLVERARQVRSWSLTLRSHSPVEWAPATVVVLSAPGAAASSSVAATLAVGVDRLSDHPVAAVDLDGAAQPLRPLLASTGTGDLVGLASSAEAGRSRRAVEDFCDMRAEVPLASAWPDGPGALPPETVRDALWRLRRRFPTLIVDLPPTCLPETATVAIAQATHIIVAAPPGEPAHEAITQLGRPISPTTISSPTTTVVSVGSPHTPAPGCQDIVHLPATLVDGETDDRISTRFGNLDAASAFLELVHRLV